ncbi:MAG: YHS domain-containing (seleno)protein [Bacillota bacterium]
MRKYFLLLLLPLALLLAACGTTHATIDTTRGEHLMLLGFDPVAYFTNGEPERGKHTLPATYEGRTYYFASDESRRAFLAQPAKYEPQFGGFCSNGAAYKVKLGSDPTQFVVRDGRLFIFGDVMGKEFWLLDPDTNIRHADQVWPDMKDDGWRWATLRGWIFRVPWYRRGPELMAQWEARHPGRKLVYDTGGALQNLVLKYPGWRAREGFSQHALGVPGEPDDR